MGMPVTTVEVAFDTDPGDTPTWTDVSDRFRRLSVRRGRRSELDRFDAGRATITLANEDRALDPTYAGGYGSYSGGYHSGSFAPNVIPMRRIRIRALWDSVTYDIFNGYVDDWRQEFMPPAEAICVVSATDAFKVLANTQLLSSASAEEVDIDGPALWWRLGDPAAAGYAREQVVGDLLLQPVGTPTWGVDSLATGDDDGAVQFTTSDDGLQGIFNEGTFPLTTAGTLEWQYRWDGAGSDVVINLATLPGGTVSGIQVNLNVSDLDIGLGNNAGGIFSVSSTGVDLRDGAAHHIAITFAAGTPIKIYIDGADHTGSVVNFTGTMANTTDKWILAVNAVNYPPYVFAATPATFDEVAIYTSALSAARAAAHSAAMIGAWDGDGSGARVDRILDGGDWPATDRNIDTGMAVLQAATLGGTVLDALQAIEETEVGALFVSADGKVTFLARDTFLRSPYTVSQATFGDDGSELEYADLSYRYDDVLIVNEAQVSRVGGVVQVVRDLASQARYLRRSRVVSGLLHRLDLTSRDYATWIVAHYKDPRLRATDMKLQPSAGNETTHFPQVLGRELMDRVTVLRRPQNLGGAIDQEALIQGIEHDVTAEEWVTTWNLSPAETETVYWLAGVVGHSEAGVTTRAGF